MKLHKGAATEPELPQAQQGGPSVTCHSPKSSSTDTLSIMAMGTRPCYPFSFRNVSESDTIGAVLRMFSAMWTDKIPIKFIKLILLIIFKL